MFSDEMIWWITVFELPVFGALFFMIWRMINEYRKDHDHISSVLEKRHAQLRETLSAYKLEVAKTYAAQTDLKDLETRIVSHLLRIEAKLDRTALKAESLKKTD